MTFFKVEVGGQDGVVDSPGVLERPGEAATQASGGYKMSVTERRAVKGDNKLTAGLLDPENYAPAYRGG